MQPSRDTIFFIKFNILIPRQILTFLTNPVKGSVPLPTMQDFFWQLGELYLVVADVACSRDEEQLHR